MMKVVIKEDKNGGSQQNKFEVGWDSIVFNKNIFVVVG